ncbi:MAG TPA: hypothetical protein VLD39_05170 [Gammaproteobacteria bacterium]|nr:hypothetical protein [Gammaproteobacteria bacterium]
MRKGLLVFAAVAALAACSSGSGSASGTPSSTAVRRGGQNLITAEEIAASGAGMETAFDIVQRLRPTMLRPRASSFGVNNQPEQVPVLVYSDEVRLGTVENLRTIPATQVFEIRYISATDETQRWGTNHSSGAIQVITKR